MLGEIDVALLFNTDNDLIEMRKKFPQVSPHARFLNSNMAVTMYYASVGFPGCVQRGLP